MAAEKVALGIGDFTSHDLLSVKGDKDLLLVHLPPVLDTRIYAWDCLM